MYSNDTRLFLLYCMRFQCLTKIVYIYTSYPEAICPQHTEPQYPREVIVKYVR